MPKKTFLPKILLVASLASTFFLLACEQAEDKVDAMADKVEDVADNVVDTVDDAIDAVDTIIDDVATTQMNAQYVSKRFDRDTYAKSIEILSSDEFEGRSPNSPGEEKTINYIANELAAAGIAPGVEGSYFQKVPLVSITASNPTMSFTVNGQTKNLKIGENSVLWTKRVVESEGVTDSPLVFVGYGSVAPEYNWNDYAGIDMEGKTAVILVNDPGYATQNDELFTGNAMTYYGRWTYKYEEAARQGAAGAIVIHETGPAGYPWEVVGGSWGGPQFDLVAADNNMSRANIESWISQSAAENLFADAGLNFADLKAAAAKPGFKPIPLSATMTASVTNTLDKSDSMNVLGVLPGSKRPDEYIIYMGHWDHLGIDPKLEGDHIFNGAVDNATGTAAVIEMLKGFAALEQRPERSIVALLVTAEEQGLLGSKHYGVNPVFPLNQTVAAINIDGMSVMGPTSNVTVVGYGASELEDILKVKAAQQQRTLLPDQNAEKGYFFRSDHFSLAKVGVPALYAEAGNQYIGQPDDYAATIGKDYTANRYHKVGDEFDPTWPLTGPMQNMDMLFEVGLELANSEDFPNWYEGNAFKSIRDASMAEKK